MNPPSSDQTEQLYANLLRETQAVVEKIRARLRRLRKRFPDLPPEVAADQATFRPDPPHESPDPHSTLRPVEAACPPATSPHDQSDDAKKRPRQA